MATLPRERETHVTKIHELKKIAKPSSELLQPNAISSPVDQEYREHAGEVRRRDDRTVRAEPPPTRRAEATTSCRCEPSRGRKKRTSGLDGDDGSDSERDNPTSLGGGNGGFVKQKKNRQLPIPEGDHDIKPKPTVTGYSASMSLTPEEEQRVKLHRQVSRQKRADEDRWRRLLDARLVNKRATERYKENLLEWARARRSPVASNASEEKYFRANSFTFQLQQSQIDRYLDENLYHDIAEIDVIDENDYLSKGISKRDLLEGIINQAESDFVLWWRQFTETREDTVLSIVDSLWTNESWIEEFIIQSTKPGEGVGLDPFVAAYGELIFRWLGVSYLVEQRWGVEELMLEWHNRNLDKTRYLDVTAMLSDSRQSEGFSQEYLDLVCGYIPSDLMESCRQQKLRQIRGGKIRELLESSSTSQEFCQNVDGEGTLSLVLFKGDLLISIKPVLPHDQRRLGWYRTPQDSCRWEGTPIIRKKPRSTYYRWEFDEGLGHFFMVGVEKEVIGVWTESGVFYHKI
ncbi:hypothetical protein F5Y08DRAFT_227339 [Xylaria arbuscula]|nr:hypothetical protein F5Y08DRAFT_227339 [Xylaria arbuscula]